MQSKHSAEHIYFLAHGNKHQRDLFAGFNVLLFPHSLCRGLVCFREPDRKRLWLCLICIITQLPSSQGIHSVVSYCTLTSVQHERTAVGAVNATRVCVHCTAISNAIVAVGETRSHIESEEPVSP